MKSPLGQLFQKEMDRREFLAHIGAGALSVIGVSGLVKGLLDYGGKSHAIRSSGYGSSSYGGGAKSRPTNIIR